MGILGKVGKIGKKLDPIGSKVAAKTPLGKKIMGVTKRVTGGNGNTGIVPPSPKTGGNALAQKVATPRTGGAGQMQAVDKGAARRGLAVDRAEARGRRRG